jgi:PAS domain S-box-containing protein
MAFTLTPAKGLCLLVLPALAALGGTSAYFLASGQSLRLHAEHVRIDLEQIMHAESLSRAMRREMRLYADARNARERADARTEAASSLKRLREAEERRKPLPTEEGKNAVKPEEIAEGYERYRILAGGVGRTPGQEAADFDALIAYYESDVRSRIESFVALRQESLDRRLSALQGAAGGVPALFDKTDGFIRLRQAISGLLEAGQTLDVLQERSDVYAQQAGIPLPLSSYKSVRRYLASDDGEAEDGHKQVKRAVLRLTDVEESIRKAEDGETAGALYRSAKEIAAQAAVPVLAALIEEKEQSVGAALAEQEARTGAILRCLAAALGLCMGVVAAVAATMRRRFVRPLARLAKAEGRACGEIDALADGYLAMETALTEAREQAERREADVRAKESELKAILDAAAAGVVIMDKEGLIRSFNPAAEYIFGYRREETAGRHIGVLIPALSEESLEAFSGCEENTCERQLSCRELEAMRKDGMAFALELTVNAFEDSDGGRMFVGIAHDASERKAAEKILKQYTKELEVAKEQAESATQLKSEFLASMSHEIRTPMNGIVGMTEMMLENALSEGQRVRAESIYDSAENLMVIINDILDFSKIEAGKLTLEPRTLNLKAELEEVVTLFGAKAAKNHVNLILDYPDSVPEYMVGDSVRIKQIFGNLISNAIKFTSYGYVRSHVERLPCDKEGHSVVRVSVQDTGVGIPKEKVGLIFEKFSQADASTTRRFGGTGLGLAICRQLTAMMDGEIEVESEEGKGSVFRFSIRLKDATEAGAAEYVRRKKSERRERGYPAGANVMFKDVSVLLAEDNRINRMLATEMLTGLGCKADHAENGKEAIKAATEKAYDVILMDCHMPEMDGYESARRINFLKKNGVVRNVPIVALTANALKEDKEECMKSGMQDYLSKPLHKKDLSAMLQKWIPAEKQAIPAAEGREEEGDVPAPEDPAVNMDKLREAQRLLKDQFPAIIEGYMEDAEKYLRNLAYAVERNDSDSAFKNAHPLKSSSQGIGLSAVAAVAEAIERQTRRAADIRSPGTSVPSLVAALRKALEQSKPALKKAIDEAA